MALRHWVLVVAIGAIFGASFGFNEILLEEFGALTISMLRMAFGAAGCWVWALASGKRMQLPSGVLTGVMVFGLFQFAVPFSAFPIAQAQITSSIAGIANAMTPVLVVIVSHFWVGGERASRLRVAGVAFGLAGTVILVTGGEDIGISDWRYVLVAMIGPISYAIALNLVAYFRSWDPVVIATWAMTGGTLAIAPMTITLEGMPTLGDPEYLIGLCILGFGLTSMPFIIMFSALPRVGATNMSLVTFIAPISAILIGALILDEPTGTVQFAGIAMILIGLVVIDGRVPERLIRTVRRYNAQLGDPRVRT